MCYFSIDGLTQVMELEAAGDYEFDTFIAFKDDENPGTFYWTQDSGCSCPIPFEDVVSREDMEHGSLERLADAAEDWSSYRGSYGRTSRSELLRQVREVKAEFGQN